ncbi:uncharacterized protein TEOVI_000860200 [Trypanosoma equiperdum]|uniref:Uncharacterized protein n=1 Tax=Trypanosoma equiperdum TaxID=5694 RepID=A0A1G4I7Q7_TRYEQ|nr:hypothetical protein, conserved [Trypanosoma equiperdum]
MMELAEGVRSGSSVFAGVSPNNVIRARRPSVEAPPMISIQRSPSAGSGALESRSRSESPRAASIGRLPPRGLPVPLRAQQQRAINLRSMSSSQTQERILLPRSRSSSLMLSSAAVIPADMVASKRFTPPGGRTPLVGPAKSPPIGFVKVMAGPPPPGMVKIPVSPSAIKSPGLSPHFNRSQTSVSSPMQSVALPSPASPAPALTPGLARKSSDHVSPGERSRRRRRRSEGKIVDTPQKHRSRTNEMECMEGLAAATEGSLPAEQSRHRRHHRLSRRTTARRSSSALAGEKASKDVPPTPENPVVNGDNGDEIAFVAEEEGKEGANTEAKQRSGDARKSSSSSSDSSVSFQFTDTNPPEGQCKEEETTPTPEEKSVVNEKCAKPMDVESPRSASRTQRHNPHRISAPETPKSKGSGISSKSRSRFGLPSVEGVQKASVMEVDEEEKIEEATPAEGKHEPSLPFAENPKNQWNAMMSTLQDQSSNGVSRRTAPSLETSNKLQEASRKHIAEQFLSILCPQQFYGKVTKLHRIRLINSERSRAPGLKEHATILVASKGVLPNQLFYPQLRLAQCDGVEATSADIPGQLDTSIVLCEAAPGNMVFAGTEVEAEHIFENDSTVTSCFTLDKSAIIFRDPVRYVLPKAMLDVRWIPYSVQGSEPLCPVHHKELQLYDSSTRELCCSLCLSKSGVDTSKLIVVPEALEGDSRRRVTETLGEHLKRSIDKTAEWMGHHQRIISVAKHKKEAVIRQFDMLISAVKSKRDEFLEHCDASFASTLSSVAKEILLAEEKVALMKAAIDHLRSDALKPLYSLQVATVASALHVGEETPWGTSTDATDISLLNSGLSVNLEGVMAELQLVSVVPYTRPPSSRRRRMGDDRQEEVTQTDDYESKRRTSQKSVPTKELTLDDHLNLSTHPHKRPLTSVRRRRSVGRGSPTGRRAAPLLPHEVFEDSDILGDDENIKRVRRLGQWITVPGCRGTCIFNAPIHKIIKACREGRNLSTRPIALQWTLRVDDPGEWVGIGVGVGGNLTTWSENHTPDLGHLWVVPEGARRQHFNLRVTLAPRVGHAKLTVHNTNGKQLDDGHIPQWRAARSCYPQITFGGRIGDVRLIDGPQLLTT